MSRNYAGSVVFETVEALRGFDNFSATPAETCAAVPKGRRHFLFFPVFGLKRCEA
jgi:hypothetical protein